jgi:hypothetical protein
MTYPKRPRDPNQLPKRSFKLTQCPWSAVQVARVLDRIE